MFTIDSFINVPLYIAAGVSALLLILLLIIKLRSKAKISLTFLISAGIMILGTIYSTFKGYYSYVVFTIILSEVVLLPYLIIKAFVNPQKLEEKKAAKKAAEISASRDNDMVNRAVIQQIEEKNQRYIELNRDLIAKLSTFFTNNNSMENFLEYCNDLFTDKIKADGCIFLIADDYDNTLAVKSFKGAFPPPYKLPEDLPHKPIRVETNLRFAQFSLQDNIFGQIFTEGQPVLITDSVKDPRVYQNGPEEFLRCGSYIFAPIKQVESVVGLVALARKPDNEKFTKDDFDNAIMLAEAVSTAIKPLYSFLDYAEHTELNKGGSIASKYQKDMLPANFLLYLVFQSVVTLFLQKMSAVTIMIFLYQEKTAYHL